MRMSPRLAAWACAAIALAAPAAAPAMRGPDSAARLQARAVADAGAAATNARRDPSRSRALIDRSLRRMREASSLALKVTGKSGRGSAARDAGAKAATSFSSGASDEADALLRVIHSGGEGVDRRAASALARTVAIQSRVSLSFARATAHVSGASATATATTLDLLATEQSGVTATLVDDLGGHSRRVHTALELAVSRSTKTEAALNAQIAKLAAG